MSVDTPVYLITGAAGGLGSALAEQLLQQDLANGIEPELILLDKSVRALNHVSGMLEKEYGVQAILMPLDMAGAAITDYEDVAAAINEQFGHLSAIFFCQAQFDGLRSLQQTHGRDWLLNLHANLGASQLLLQTTTGLLNNIKQSKVLFCCNAVDAVDSAYWGAYGVAQCAIPALAKQWALELSNTSIRVGLCQPAAMRTALRAEVWPATPPEEWPTARAAATAILEWLKRSDLEPELQLIDLRGNHV